MRRLRSFDKLTLGLVLMLGMPLLLVVELETLDTGKMTLVVSLLLVLVILMPIEGAECDAVVLLLVVDVTVDDVVDGVEET